MLSLAPDLQLDADHVEDLNDHRDDDLGGDPGQDRQEQAGIEVREAADGQDAQQRSRRQRLDQPSGRLRGGDVGARPDEPEMHHDEARQDDRRIGAPMPDPPGQVEGAEPDAERQADASERPGIDPARVEGGRVEDSEQCRQRVVEMRADLQAAAQEQQPDAAEEPGQHRVGQELRQQRGAQGPEQYEHDPGGEGRDAAGDEDHPADDFRIGHARGLQPLRDRGGDRRLHDRRRADEGERHPGGPPERDEHEAAQHVGRQHRRQAGDAALGERAREDELGEADEVEQEHHHGDRRGRDNAGSAQEALARAGLSLGSGGRYVGGCHRHGIRVAKSLWSRRAKSHAVARADRRGITGLKLGQTHPNLMTAARLNYRAGAGDPGPCRRIRATRRGSRTASSERTTSRRRPKAAPVTRCLVVLGTLEDLKAGSPPCRRRWAASRRAPPAPPTDRVSGEALYLGPRAGCSAAVVSTSPAHLDCRGALRGSPCGEGLGAYRASL
ncbi:hypothetical protein ACRAWG_26675 [Methylobacterium sp. P31]